MTIKMKMSQNQMLVEARRYNNSTYKQALDLQEECERNMRLHIATFQLLLDRLVVDMLTKKCK